MSARKYSQQEKEKYVEEFMNSNESQTTFARARGIPESTFRGWLNYQNNNDISFGSIELNTDTDEVFSFKSQHISVSAYEKITITKL